MFPWRKWKLQKVNYVASHPTDLPFLLKFHLYQILPPNTQEFLKPRLSNLICLFQGKHRYISLEHVNFFGGACGFLWEIVEESFVNLRNPDLL